MAYHLKRTGEVDLLIPPGDKVIDEKPALIVRLPNARKDSNSPICNIVEQVLTLRWSGRAANIQFQPEIVQTGSRIPIPAIQSVNRFRRDLHSLEANGCLQGGDASRLIDRIVESQAMPSALSIYFRYGAPWGGFVDLKSPLTLKIIEPVKRDTGGYRVTRYKVSARSDSGYILSELSSHVMVDGAEVTDRSEPLNGFRIPNTARFFRLSFMVRKSPSDHDSALLMGTSPVELEQAANLLEREGHTSCHLTAKPVSCLMFPSQVAASVEVQVYIRGQPVYISLGGTVRDALSAVGVKKPEGLLENLLVKRPFSGKLSHVRFDPNKPDILGLVLIGDEQIDW